jgi:hypothetical protein
MEIKAPWEIHPDLSAERLEIVALLLAKGRDDAVDRHDPAVGDNGWTLGCKAYAYGKHQIVKADAEQGDEEHWLGIIDAGALFTFRIGSIPVRFYQGPADEPHHRTLRQCREELRQLSLALNDQPDYQNLAYRFAVETSPDGTAEHIVFIGTTGKSIGCFYNVPLSKVDATIHPIDDSREEGIDLPPPAVGPRTDDEGEANKGGGSAA